MGFLSRSFWLAVGSLCVVFHGDVAAETAVSSTKMMVTTGSFESLTFYPSSNAPAQVISLNHSNIPAQINAVLQKMLVRVGDHVTQGQVLARLDCAEFVLNLSAQQAQLEQLNNNYQFQQRQFQRAKNLANKKSIGAVELDKINTALLSAKAQRLTQQALLATAQLNQQRCAIKAPFDGLVTDRFASEGEMVATGQSVVAVVQLDNVEVVAQIALGDQRSFRQAKSYAFTSEGQQYSLIKRILMPLIKDKTRSREVRMNFNASPAMAGSTGRLVWPSPIPHLPAHLLQNRQGHYGVFVVKQGRAEFRVIEQAQEGRPIPILGHDWDKQQIVIDGRYGLTQGTSVGVVD